MTIALCAAAGFLFFLNIFYKGDIAIVLYLAICALLSAVLVINGGGATDFPSWAVVAVLLGMLAAFIGIFKAFGERKGRG